MVSNNFLDAALAVGIFIQTMKLGDIFLRPHQQKWVQEKADTLALYLSEFQPLEWYIKAINKRRISFINVSILWCLLVYLVSPFTNRGIESFTNGQIYFWIYWVGNFLIVISILFAELRYGSQLRAWLFSDGEFRVFAQRYFMLLFCCFFPMVLLAGIVFLFLQLLQFYSLTTHTREFRAFVRRYLVTSFYAMLPLVPLGLVAILLIKAPQFFPPPYSLSTRILITASYTVIIFPLIGAIGLWLSTVITGYIVILVRILITIIILLVKIPPAKPEACKCEPLKAG